MYTVTAPLLGFPYADTTASFYSRAYFKSFKLSASPSMNFRKIELIPILGADLKRQWTLCDLIRRLASSLPILPLKPINRMFFLSYIFGFAIQLLK